MGQREVIKKIGMEKLEYMCRSRAGVGLGFRDTEIFNFTLLAKQVRD